MTAHLRRVATVATGAVLVAGLAGCAQPGENHEPNSTTGISAACTPSKLATVRDGVLTIATDNPALEPWFSGNNPSNGEGFEAGVGYRIAVALGFHPHNVVWRRVPFRTIIAAGQKPFDMALDEVTIRPERANKVDFSTPYFNVSQAVLVKREGKFGDAATITDLKSARLGALAGTTSYDAIGKQIAPTNAATGYNSMADAIDALNGGQLDGIVTDLPTAFELARGKVSDSKVVGQLPTSGGEERFGVVLPKGSTVTQCVDKALAKLNSDGGIEQLRTEWIVSRGAPVLK